MNSPDFMDEYLGRVIYGWKVTAANDRVTQVRFEPEKDPISVTLPVHMIVEDGEVIQPGEGYHFPEGSLKELHYLRGVFSDYRWGMVFDTDANCRNPEFYRHTMDDCPTPETFEEMMQERGQ